MNDLRKYFYNWPTEFASHPARRRYRFWRAAGIFLLWLTAVLIGVLVAYVGTGQ